MTSNQINTGYVCVHQTGYPHYLVFFEQSCVAVIMTTDLLREYNYNGLCFTYLLKTGSANETSAGVAHCWSVSSESRVA